ncbi:MAG: CoA transferase [Gammaproteobacteria bacterium]|nr:CoA transferase [Gammaproteobacteria bacterium]
MDRYPFSGLKVLDVATVVAGPAAAVMLADFGADIIKVEKPGTGDIMRQVGRTTMPGADSDYMWNLEGRNKRGIVLDLKQEAGMGDHPTGIELYASIAI